MIRLDEVTVVSRGRTVLDRVSVTIAAGEVTHLAGPNGSGKTTLIRAIAGLQRYSGSITLGSGSSGEADARRRLYVCFDDAPVYSFLTGYENVRSLLGRPLPRAVIARTAPELAGHDLLRRAAGTLSHGQRKRLHLVAALAADASFLLFDEALNGVDTAGVRAIAAALDGTPATVLFTGHHSDVTVGLAHRRLILSAGRIVGERNDDRA